MDNSRHDFAEPRRRVQQWTFQKHFAAAPLKESISHICTLRAGNVPLSSCSAGPSCSGQQALPLCNLRLDPGKAANLSSACYLLCLGQEDDSHKAGQKLVEAVGACTFATLGKPRHSPTANSNIYYYIMSCIRCHITVLSHEI